MTEKQPGFKGMVRTGSVIDGNGRGMLREAMGGSDLDALSCSSIYEVVAGSWGLEE